MQKVDQTLPYDDWHRLAKDGAFEEVLAALHAVVTHLEAGSPRLEDAVRCYEAGSLLARRCEHLLDEAELRITRLDSDDDDQ